MAKTVHVNLKGEGIQTSVIANKNLWGERKPDLFSYGIVAGAFEKDKREATEVIY